MRRVSRDLGDGDSTYGHGGDDEGDRDGPPVVVAPSQPSQASAAANIDIPLSSSIDLSAGRRSAMEDS